MRFITDWEWTPISLSALGIGMALIWFLEYYFVGRNKPKPVSLESQSSSFLQKLISKVEKPFDSTTMVTRKSDWEQVLKELMKDLETVPILGFDCEWNNINHINREVGPVALIQLASHTGRCILVCVHFMGCVPPSLTKLLEDERILKVGVGLLKHDAPKLYEDFGIRVRRAFDVSDLIHQHPDRVFLGKKPGLAGLSKTLLDVELNKEYDITNSNWASEVLDIKQIKYAAQDALASLAICLKLVSDITLIDETLNGNLQSVYTSWSKTVGS